MRDSHRPGKLKTCGYNYNPAKKKNTLLIFNKHANIMITRREHFKGKYYGIKELMIYEGKNIAVS